MAKNIYQVALEFEKKLRKTAFYKLSFDSNYPATQTVTPIIEKAVDLAKKNNSQLFEGFQRIDSVSVQNAIDNTSSVYFQLIFEPNRYQELLSEPFRSQLINYLQPLIEQRLSNEFIAFNFIVKIGVVPL